MPGIVTPESKPSGGRDDARVARRAIEPRGVRGAETVRERTARARSAAEGAIGV